MSKPAGIRSVLLLVFGLMMSAGVAVAQGFPIYKESLPVASLNSDRLFSESLAGRAILEASREKSITLSEENRRIEAELEQEERELTEKRKAMPAAEFQLLADAFDAKVVTAGIFDEGAAHPAATHAREGHRVRAERTGHRSCGQFG
jgi:Skp family chaperone for outer membrane proteins